MIRKIIGVVVGYVVMFICMFLLFTAAYLAMGADRAFEPRTYLPSMLWTLVTFILGFVAAVIGGFVAAAIGKGGATTKILAGVVLVIGMAAAIACLVMERPNEVRTGDVPNMEAMMKAQEPVWVAFVNPFIGVIGVLVGGRLRKNKN